MHWWYLPVLSGVGVLAGILNVLAGGGSLLSLPALVLLGVPEGIANGSNRVAILAQNLAAVSGFKRQGWSHWRLSSSLALVAVPGAGLGAWCASRLSDQDTRWLFMAVMLLVLVQSLWPRQARDRSDPANADAKRPVLAHLAMLGVGFYGGLIQAGVGFLLMAALAPALGRSLVHVNMHKVFIVGIYTLLALAVFIWQDQIWWSVGIALAVGNAAGGWIGSHLAVTKGDAWIRRVYQGALLVFLLLLLVRS
jgi:uncharacterized protein